MLVCITSAERADAVTTAVHELVAVATGVISVADVQVVRGDKF